MPAQNHFRNELDTMRSLSYVIEERGIEKGIKQERLNIVNTAYASSSDYIPCICWNDVAEKAGKYEIGDLVKLSGRLQSREYKMKGTENTIRRIMEVSIFSIENLGKEESAGQSDK